MTSIYGYARTAADEDDLEDQRRRLFEAGCIRVFADADHAADAVKPQLLAAIGMLSTGDTLVVRDGGRLGASWPDRLPAVAAVRQRQAHFRSLDAADSGFDTTTMPGRLMVDGVIAARGIVPLATLENVPPPAEPEPAPETVPVPDRTLDVAPDAPFSDAWIGPDGLGVDEWGYCITVIAGITPKEAMRRFGASATDYTTIAELRPLAEQQVVTSQPVIAFASGGCTVLVEDGGFQGIRRPELSAGTTAGSRYLTVDGDSRLVISRDGTVLVDWDGDDDAPEDGTEPELLQGVLDSMTAQARIQEDEMVDQLEVLCRFFRIRPDLAEVSVPVLGGVAPW